MLKSPSKGVEGSEWDDEYLDDDFAEEGGKEPGEIVHDFGEVFLEEADGLSHLFGSVFGGNDVAFSLAIHFGEEELDGFERA